MRATALLASTALWGASHAQTAYRPFPEGNAGWVGIHGARESVGFYDLFNSSDRITEFLPDTVIADTLYHRLSVRGVGETQMLAPPYSAWPYIEPMRTLCLFRQDTATRKVFVYQPESHQSMLWFDFSLGLGPYPATWALEGAEAEVLALDSMELNDGWHRTWVLGHILNGEPLDSAFCTIIEGIGSNRGLVPVGYGPNFYEAFDSLRCHSVDGLAVLPLGSSACDLTLTVPEVSRSYSNPLVIPNPTTTEFSIEGIAGQGPFVVTLLDGMGRPVKRWSRAGRSTRFDVHGSSPGWYTLVVERKNGRALHVKLIIE